VTSGKKNDNKNNIDNDPLAS